jgi:hypothetical protein
LDFWFENKPSGNPVFEHENQNLDKTPFLVWIRTPIRPFADLRIKNFPHGIIPFSVRIITRFSLHYKKRCPGQWHRTPRGFVRTSANGFCVNTHIKHQNKKTEELGCIDILGANFYARFLWFGDRLTAGRTRHEFFHFYWSPFASSEITVGKSRAHSTSKNDGRPWRLRFNFRLRRLATEFMLFKIFSPKNSAKKMWRF